MRTLKVSPLVSSPPSISFSRSVSSLCHCLLLSVTVSLSLCVLWWWWSRLDERERQLRRALPEQLRQLGAADRARVRAHVLRIVLEAFRVDLEVRLNACAVRVGATTTDYSILPQQQQTGGGGGCVSPRSPHFEAARVCACLCLTRSKRIGTPLLRCVNDGRVWVPLLTSHAQRLPLCIVRFRLLRRGAETAWPRRRLPSRCVRDTLQYGTMYAAEF